MIPNLEMINKFLEKILLYFRIFKFRCKIFGIKRKNSEAFKKVDRNLEKEHVTLWKKLFPIINKNWLRFYSNTSGVTDIRYVPEDLYYAVIERRLNDTNYSVHIAHKAFYDIRFNSKLFPINYLKNISGTYLDEENNIIKEGNAREIFESLNQDLVIKPTIDSGGGKDVILLRYGNNKYLDSKNEEYNFIKLEKQYKRNFIVQKKIKQHSFFSKFNPSSINTIRIFTYRSLDDESLNILHMILRMGRENSFVDNQRAGGISVGIKVQSGKFTDQAFDKYGKLYNKHPDSGIKFDKQTIPYFLKMKKKVTEIAYRIPSHRLLSFDVTITAQNKVKIIEINTSNVEINFLQLQGKSLFQNYTDEIIRYCKNETTDNFNYLRTSK